MSRPSPIPDLLSIEITENHSSYQIAVDITGFNPENVKVSAAASALIVELVSTHNPGDSYYLGELESECYRRIIPIGYELNAGDLVKRYENGVLQISVTKPASSMQSKIHNATEVA